MRDADLIREGFGFFTASGDEEEAVAAALAALDRLEAERDAALAALREYREQFNRWDEYEGPKKLAAAEAERDRLAEANDIAAQEIASAMTSLSTGPAKDGYAYSCLGRAAAALAATETTT